MTINDLKFHCNECGGTTYYVDYCDNPCCPNQPCCGKPKDQCYCYLNDDKKEEIIDNKI